MQCDPVGGIRYIKIGMFSLKVTRVFFARKILSVKLVVIFMIVQVFVMRSAFYDEVGSSAVFQSPLVVHFQKAGTNSQIFVNTITILY